MIFFFPRFKYTEKLYNIRVVYFNVSCKVEQNYSKTVILYHLKFNLHGGGRSIDEISSRRNHHIQKTRTIGRYNCKTYTKEKRKQGTPGGMYFDCRLTWQKHI